jgi:hypothetical protein
VTIERTDRAPTAAELAEIVGLKAKQLHSTENFVFLATHRQMMFEVWKAKTPNGFIARQGEFVPRAKLATLAMSSPQRRIVQQLP